MTQIPIDTDLQVFLAQGFNETTWQEHRAKALVVVPDSSAWNDFTKNFRAELHFVGFPEPHAPILMRMMLEGAPRTSLTVSKILGPLPYIGVELIEEAFVSVLANTVAYRTLVKRLGFEDAITALRKMHDAVVTRLEAVDEQTLELAHSLDFAQSVLREDATWDAYRQGGRYLTPTSTPDVDDAAHSFNVDVQLQGMHGMHKLDADFEDDFPLSRRMLVLVGENGSGKTRFLNSIVNGLQTVPEWEVPSEHHQQIFNPRPQFSRLLVFSSVSSDAYPAHLPPWLGVDYRFHRMTGHSRGTNDDLAQSLLDCMRSLDEIEGLDGLRGRELLDEILQLLGIRPDLYVEVTPIGQGTDLLPVPMRVNDRYYLPFFELQGEQRRLQLQARMVPHAPPTVLVEGQETRSLSSGEQVLLRFATQAIGSVRKGTLFLFDEPETHLHPRYVSALMSMLDRLLEWSGSIAVIATHSAYIVREVPARRVRIVEKNRNGEVLIEPPVMQTFGASIDTISQFVFGDIALKHRFQEVLDSWLFKTPDATLAHFRERFREDMNAETLSYLAQIDAERHPK